MTAAFIGLVVLANYVAFENHFRADTTATNQFSLAKPHQRTCWTTWTGPSTSLPTIPMKSPTLIC